MSLPKPYYSRGPVQIWHGDCLQLLPEIEKGSVRLFFLDPPYGHSNNNDDLVGRREKALGRSKGEDAPNEAPRPIANDGPEANDMFLAFLPEAKRILTPDGCCCCCCCGGGPDPQFARWSLWLDEVLAFKMMVVWDKGPMGMGWHYRRSYETVLVAERTRGKALWRDTTDRVENIIRPGAHGVRKIIPNHRQHPTEKPVELPAHFIRLHTDPDDLVCDPFMGACSTGVAAIRTGRRFIGIELDEYWCAVAARRLDRELDQPQLPFLRTSQPALLAT